MTDEEKSVKEFIFASKPTDAQMVAREKIKELKKEKHDLKYELYQLRQRVDKLEQKNKIMEQAVAKLILHDQQCQEVVGLLTNTVTTLIKELEEENE